MRRVSTVIFLDETTGGPRADGCALEIFEERLTLRELIRRRVYQEVAEFNANPLGRFRGLVQPGATERALNGDRTRHIDWQRQYEAAIEAFGRNGFVVLVGDRQITDLDAEVDLGRDIEITFLKLVPLVGG